MTAFVALSCRRPSPWKLPLEFQDLPDLRAAPAVDALVVVTDHAEVAAEAGKLREQRELGVVGVLVLVDEKIPVAPLVLLQQRRVLSEQRQRQEQQVVEVHRAHRAQPELIFRQELRGAELVFVAGVAGRSTGAQPREDAEQAVHVEPLVVDLQIAQQPLHQRSLIAGVEHGELRGECERLVLLADDPHPEGMEGAHGHPPRFRRAASAEGQHRTNQKHNVPDDSLSHHNKVSFVCECQR